MKGVSRGALQVLIALFLLVIGALAGWLGRGLITVPPDVPRIALYDDWRLGCPPLSQEPGACTLVQDVTDSKSHREVAHILLAPTKSGRQLIITVPYDVLLPSGIGLALGKDKVRLYPYTTCDGTGCLAIVSVDDALLKALTPQRKASLRVARLDNQTVDLPFSLKGFARAEDAYAADQAKRHNWWSRMFS